MEFICRLKLLHCQVVSIHRLSWQLSLSPPGEERLDASGRRSPPLFGAGGGGGGGLESSNAKQGRNINNKLLIAPPLLSRDINKRAALMTGRDLFYLWSLWVFLKRNKTASVLFDAFLHQGMWDKMCCFLSQTSLWWKTYFFFVSGRARLQGEHFRLLLCPRFSFLFTLSLFSLRFLSPEPGGNARGVSQTLLRYWPSLDLRNHPSETRLRVSSLFGDELTPRLSTCLKRWARASTVCNSSAAQQWLQSLIPYFQILVSH